jgi:hypothetical protein
MFVFYRKPIKERTRYIMKKLIIIIGFSLLLTVVAITVVSASGSPWNLFSKLKANLGFKDGVIYQKPDNQQRKDVIKSINPETNNASMQVFNQAPGLFKKEIQMNLDGNDIILTFDYVKQNNINVALPLPDHKPGAGYQLYPYPNSSKELIEFDGSIYVLDIEKGSIQKLLHDITGTYSIQVAKQISKQKVEEGDPFVWWGSRPSVNPSGTMMVFYTNRSGVDEIWVKDLLSGDERPLLKSVLTVKGWISETEFIASSFSEIIKVNVETSESISFGDAGAFEISFPNLVYQLDVGSILFENLNTGEVRSYSKEELGRITQMATWEGHSIIALINQPDRSQPQFKLYTIDSGDFMTKKIDIPTDKVPLAIRWINKNTILLIVQDQNTNDEESLFVDIDKF